VLLAHELGHAMADDVQRENGHCFRDFSSEEMEGQAYFVQRIVSRHVKEAAPDLEDQDLDENVLTMGFERAAAFAQAGKLFNQALSEASVRRVELVGVALDQRTLG
jgi:oligoendopeptidase F